MCNKSIENPTERTKYYPLIESIVSAAARSPDGFVVMSRRHGDDIFFSVVDKIYPKDKLYHDWEQGFVTSKGRFVDRKEAWDIAKAACQIKRVTGSVGILYSEDLY